MVWRFGGVHGPKLVPKRFKNGSWRPPSGFKMAPWRSLGGFWRPWGALGRPRWIFERFWELLRVPFGGPKSIKKALKNKLNPNFVFDAYFGPSGGSLGHFWGPFWKYFKVFFEVPSREAGFLKNLEKPLEKQ